MGSDNTLPLCMRVPSCVLPSLCVHSTALLMERCPHFSCSQLLYKAKLRARSSTLRFRLALNTGCNVIHRTIKVKVVSRRVWGLVRQVVREGLPASPTEGESVHQRCCFLNTTP
jgi:hypothetical protein